MKVAAEIKDFDPTEYIEKKEARRTDRYCQFAVAAALEALKDAGTDFKDHRSLSGRRYCRQRHRRLADLGDMSTVNLWKKVRDGVSVFFIPMMISNMAAGTIAMKTDFKGVNFAPVTACATSTHAIGEAYRQIKHGYLEACVTGGAEAAITRIFDCGL